MRVRRPKAKRLSASWGLCLWTPLGTPSPDPRYTLTLPRSP